MSTISKASDYIKEQEAKQRLIKESEAQDAYAKKFKETLEKYNVKSPSELDDEKKKEFFSELKGVTEELDAMVKKELPTEVPVQPENVTPAPVATAKPEEVGKEIEIVKDEEEDLAAEIEKELLAMAEVEELEDDEELQPENVTESKSRIPSFDAWLASKS